MKGLQDAGFCVIPIRRHRAELEGKYAKNMCYRTDKSVPKIYTL